MSWETCRPSGQFMAWRWLSLPGVPLRTSWSATGPWRNYRPRLGEDRGARSPRDLYDPSTGAQHYSLVDRLVLRWRGVEEFPACRRRARGRGDVEATAPHERGDALPGDAGDVPQRVGCAVRTAENDRDSFALHGLVVLRARVCACVRA